MLNVTVRILAIECIARPSMASNLFIEVAHRAACDFVLLARLEPVALAFAVVVLVFVVLEALFVELGLELFAAPLPLFATALVVAV
jgi:hypothetical protein